MQTRSSNASTPFRLPRRRLRPLALALGMMLAACARQTPKGQVVATVNGQEITAQDLAAEARARGGAAVPAPVLLQNVIGRVLLAQAAHTNKLDAYAGYPSDMARMKEDYLARRMLQTVVKPAAAPTPAQVAQVIASHPFDFEHRQRIDITQLKFSGQDAVNAIQGLNSLDAMADRLKSLGVTYDKADRTLDTAQLPDALAARLVAQPIGSLFTIPGSDAVNEIVVRSREPVEVPQAQQQALAAEMISRESTASQVQAEVNRLGKQAHIAYQPGFAPPKPGAKAAS